MGEAIMGLFGKKEKKKLVLPENGHWVLVCKECGERIPIPPHTEMPGLVSDFDPDRAMLRVTYSALGKRPFTYAVDGLKNFFDVEAEEPNGLVLAASFRDNLQIIHRHIAKHYNKFNVMYLQSVDFFSLTYTKAFAPGSLTYENNQLLQLDMLVKLAANPKPGMLNPKEAEIPGYSWPLI